MGFGEQVNKLNVKITNGTNFIINKLKNFKTLSLGEQIAYPVTILGFILFMAGMVMLII